MNFSRQESISGLLRSRSKGNSTGSGGFRYRCFLESRSHGRPRRRKTLRLRASNWPRRMRCYDIRVNRRFHTFVSVAAILLIAVSQMCELLDRWDTIADIGHDSEFMFIVIGMCIALCVLLALLIVRLARIFFSLVARLLLGVSPPAQPHSYGTDYLLLLFSPPMSFTSLRI